MNSIKNVLLLSEPCVPVIPVTRTQSSLLRQFHVINFHFLFNYTFCWCVLYVLNNNNNNTSFLRIMKTTTHLQSIVTIKSVNKKTGEEERVTSNFSVTTESPAFTKTKAMAVIAPLKAHLVKTTHNERSQPPKTCTWNGGRHITGSAIYSTRGIFCC